MFDFTSAVASQQQADWHQHVSTMPTNDDRPALNDEEINSEDKINMEIDELNLHPCMISMVCLLKHMSRHGIGGTTTSSTDMPPWMICLYKKFHDSTVHMNIKLFIMRLITHTHEIFRSYARYWLTPILHLCNDIFGKVTDGLNTFLIDTLVIALSWHPTAIPSDLDSSAVQRLVESLFVHCAHTNVQVMRSNLDLIKTLTELWKERIQMPIVTMAKLLSDVDTKSKQNAIGLNLLGILLANDILPLTFNVDDLTEEKFNEILLKNMKNTHRTIYAAAAEVVGMLLTVRQRRNQSNERLLEQLNYLLKWHCNQPVLDTYVTCVYSIQKHYPALVDKTYVLLIHMR
jgi:DNA-dependent protein kinase catalytic subunit